MHHSLSTFNLQLLVPAMSSEGIYFSIQACCGTTEITSFSLFIGWGFFLSHMFVECLIRGLTAFLFPAADTALQQRQLANSTASRHLGAPAGTRLAQSLQPQHPASQPSHAPACPDRLTHFQRQEGAWKSLGTVPAYGGRIQRNTRADGTVVTLPVKLSLKFWDMTGGLKTECLM